MELGPDSKLPNVLERNSSILVNIDDLRDGLIVVSFTHTDNQYQGVLFQLNRERGIPSGISYPKDYLAGTESFDADTAPPIFLRKSYFQELSPSVTSKPSLRRTIKPPARFKNNRSALRLRTRPVLCAKCKECCAEKDDPPPLVSPAKPQTTKSLDPKEYSFSIVGGTGVVESYWRRPSMHETYPEELNGELNWMDGAQANSPDGPDPNGRIFDNGNESFDSCEFNQDYAYPLLPDGTIDAKLSNGHSKNRKVKKPKRSLKRPVKRRNLFGKSWPIGRTGEPSSQDLPDCNQETEGPGDEDSREPPTPPDKNDETEPENGEEKWGSRFRKKCAVPVRFRDSNLLTNQVFKFKKRRANETAVSEELQEPVETLRRPSGEEVPEPFRVLTPPPPIKGPFLPVPTILPEYPLESSEASSEPQKRSIKITLKSLGLNRIIVVPTKDEEAAEVRNFQDLEPKAARKALKKAKKEKRRRHKSRDSSQNPHVPESSPELPMMPRLTPRPTRFNSPKRFPPVLDPNF